MKAVLENLNEEQKQAVTHGSGPLMILAGAGSGKTRVLSHRVAWLIESGLAQPEEILLLTFTNKAAKEMLERVKGILAAGQTVGFSGTFHSFSVQVLRRYANVIGMSDNFVIYDADDAESLIKKIMTEFGIDTKQTRPGTVASIISRMKNDLLEPNDVTGKTREPFYEQVHKVWRAYQSRLRQNKAVDFDDLLIQTVKLLQIDEVRSKINDRFKWVLVDEYQDTNKVQFEMTRLLAGANANLTVVGDAAQAIYSFRGADHRNLLLLESTFPGIVKMSLPKNYRSTEEVLAGAWGVIKNNTGHPTMELTNMGNKGEKIELYEALDEKDEARYVVNQAVEMKKLDYSCAVIYRTNAQSRSIEDELLKKRISYTLVGGVRFYARAEIKDMLAYLRLIVNPDDEISRARAEKIGKRKLQMFDQWRLNQKGTPDEYPEKILMSVLEVTTYLSKFDERDEEDKARIENINELLAVASDFESLNDFLISTALAESESKKGAHDGSALTLLTAHAAKGLEFDVVFLVGAEEGLFPHARSMMDKMETEEERRLFYVAMTRTRKKLYVCWSQNRLVYGGRKSTITSRFIAEIPQSVTNQKRQNNRWQTDRDDDFLSTPRRIIVPDWEVDKLTKNDFDEIDNW